jgi:hypothetical protein
MRSASPVSSKSVNNQIGSASRRPAGDDRARRNTGSISRRTSGAGGDAPAAKRIGCSYAGPYRLDVFPLSLPPLRERLEDLPLLVVAILAELEPRTGKRGFVVTDAGLRALAHHRWPGNVRELANVLERATLVATSTRLGPRELGLSEGEGASPSTLTLEGASPSSELLVTLAENGTRSRGSARDQGIDTGSRA